MAILKYKSVIEVLFVLSLTRGAVSLVGLPCKRERQTCSALVSFTPVVETNLSAIVALFQVKNYRHLAGANAWELSVGRNATIPRGLTVKVPITCACSNGSGISKGGPVYTVMPNDTLSTIADTVFGELITFMDITAVNPKITDPNIISVGDKYRIPLPCTCSSSSSSLKEIHYSYVVPAGSTLQGIASEMGSTQSTLMAVNNITDPSTLAAGQLLDVPLTACSSNISKKSRDRNLLVANGSYTITAGNCLQCSCGPSDLDLYCMAAPLSASCSSMKCKNSNLLIGNITKQKTSAGCNVTKCSYNGYIKKRILTLLETSLQRQCPAKHVLPTLTTPSSTAPAPPPAAESPGISPSSSPLITPSSTVPSPSHAAESPAISPSNSPLTTPSSTVPAPPPAAESPGIPPNNSSTPGSTGLPGSPNRGSPPSNSLAADSLTSSSVVTMLVLGLLSLIHFGEW